MSTKSDSPKPSQDRSNQNSTPAKPTRVPTYDSINSGVRKIQESTVSERVPAPAAPKKD